MLKPISICACMVAVSTFTVADQMQAPVASSATKNDSPSRMVSVHKVPPITADVLSTVIAADGSEKDLHGQYFRSSDGNIREDSPAGSVITDFKAGTITTLNAGTKQAVVISTPGPKGRYVSTNRPSVTPTIKDLGETTVEGHPVTKRVITVDDSSGQTTEVWTATDLRMTVLLKVTSTNGQSTTRQYQNIKQAEPDQALFTVPEGYTIVRKSQRDASTPKQE